jgi:nucleoside-diphosphate-sugar epimerase
MRITVIGSGHIGTFLIPRLIRAGHEVVTISRGQRSRYADDSAWQEVRQGRAARAGRNAVDA